MLKAEIKINGKLFTLTGTETEIKNHARNLIRFSSTAEMNRFLDQLVITPKSETK